MIKIKTFSSTTQALHSFPHNYPPNYIIPFLTPLPILNIASTFFHQNANFVGLRWFRVDWSHQFLPPHPSSSPLLPLLLLCPPSTSSSLYPNFLMYVGKASFRGLWEFQRSETPWRGWSGLRSVDSNTGIQGCHRIFRSGARDPGCRGLEGCHWAVRDKGPGAQKDLKVGGKGSGEPTGL